MLSRSTYDKLTRIGFVTLPFTGTGALAAMVMHWPLDQVALTSTMVGLGIGAFEEFFVQGSAGRGLRSMSILRSTLIYAAAVIGILLVMGHLSHLALGRLDRLGEAYRRLPIAIPLAYSISILGILSLRIIGFLGLRNLGALLTGRYQRPVVERKAFLFVDMKDSTAIAEKLGALEARALIGKLLFDISKPISDHRGDIYLYTGDGLIAVWDWENAVAGKNILRATEGIFAAIDRERDTYRARFGMVPLVRVGAHGGDVVISEQGDARRAIGVYGDAINIAARMEQAAKKHHETALFSSDLVEALRTDGSTFEFLSDEPVKGITRPVSVYRLVQDHEERTPNPAGSEA